jgi:hypothetical protein
LNPWQDTLAGLGPLADGDESDTLRHSQPLLAELHGASISGRVATGPRAGHRIAEVGDAIVLEDIAVPSAAWRSLVIPESESFDPLPHPNCPARRTFQTRSGARRGIGGIRGDRIEGLNAIPTVFPRTITNRGGRVRRAATASADRGS